MEDVQDHRVKEGICGVVFHTANFEWICVKPVHAQIYTRKSSDRTHHKGDIKFDTNPGADKHYFVNRWPNRNRES